MNEIKKGQWRIDEDGRHYKILDISLDANETVGHPIQFHKKPGLWFYREWQMKNHAVVNDPALIAYLEEAKSIGLSELTYGMLCCDGVIVTVQDAKERVQRGEEIEELFTVTPEWTDSILKQAYDEHQQGICSEYLSAPNRGVRVLIDL